MNLEGNSWSQGWDSDLTGESVVAANWLVMKFSGLPETELLTVRRISLVSRELLPGTRNPHWEADNTCWKATGGWGGVAVELPGVSPTGAQLEKTDIYFYNIESFNLQTGISLLLGLLNVSQ